MKIVIRDDEKKDKAVSAIIGTILIVAITVVLAATLYAVLGGFSGLIGKPTPTASMTVSSSGVGTPSESYSLTFTSVSSNLSLSSTALKVVYSGITATWSYTSSASEYNSSVTAGGLYATISGGGYLTYLTTIKITVNSPSTSSTTYPAITSVSLIDTSTGGTVASQSNL